MSPALIPLSVTILAEARELLSALRRNRRFGYLLPFAASTQPSEHPLVKELKSLRDVIRIPVTTTAPSHPNLISAPALLIPADALLNALDPFFEVVRSRDASGIITGVALQSLCRISTRLIRLATHANLLSQYATVLSSIVDAAAACRFDATDPAADEVVLARITRVISVVCASDAAPLLSDASTLRAVEACLAIASGRRRASDLLKRTADTALIDIFETLARSVTVIVKAHPPVNPATKFPSAFVPGVTGSAFGYALDSDAFGQHGPASLAILVALLQLSSRMSDPFYAQSSFERALGLQLLSTFITSAGSALRCHAALKRIVLRDCARGLLRSLGLFKSQPSVLAYAFTISINMVHALQEDVAPFLLALLERVFPYYISGIENVLPKTTSVGDNAEVMDANGNVNGNGQLPPSTSSANIADRAFVEIDPVIREIGLEALADLLSIPGLLCIVYRLADCDMSRADVVEPLMKSLGYAGKLNGFRRRSKRLRASNSGTTRMAGPASVESDEDDIAMQNAKGTPELSRYGRSAALLCADVVLIVIDTISDRLKLEAAGLSKPPHMDDVALEKSKILRKDKVRLQNAAVAFNASEKVGKSSKLLVLLGEHGLINSRKDADGTVKEDLEDDVRAIVRFIRETPELSKEKIGCILGEPDNLSRRVLADYAETFDFENRLFTESLRVYLESFRLPGESQKIDRIVQSFANRYFEQNKPKDDRRKAVSPTNHDSPTSTFGVDGGGPDSKGQNPSVIADGNGNAEDAHESRNLSVLRNADAAYVLSYSVVMLNTDQHNESIRKKMTPEDFIKNSRGINDGEDLPKWFLTQVFDSIAAVEIRMSNEAGVGALTDLLWDEQLRKAGGFGAKFPSNSDSRVFDEQVFLLAWESGVVAANSILNEAGQPNTVQKALEGFLSVSRCATTYKISRPTDAVISSLCTATTVRDGPLHGAIVRFGTDIKAQMASVALSGVSRECGDWLRSDGWRALVAYLLRLHALCLLPVELEQRIGSFGPELVGVNKQTLPPSNQIPAWWPSAADRAESVVETAKPRKVQKPNGFFAAILAASIGSEIESEDEEDDDARVGDGVKIRRVSHTAPFYVRTRTREDTEARDLARKCIAGCRIEDVVINEAKVLQSTSLEYLCKAIAQSAFRLMEMGKKKDVSENGGVEGELGALSTDDSVLEWTDIAPTSPRNDSSILVGVSSRRVFGTVPDTETDFPSFGLIQPWEGNTRHRDERKAREFVVAFCIDILCELTLQNRDRLHIPWPELHGLLVDIIAPAVESSAVLERAVVALLRVGVRLLHREELRDDVLRGFNLLVRLPPEIADGLSLPVAAGVYNIVKGHGSIIQSTSGWHAILSILESLPKYHVQAREIGLATITLILSEVTSPVAVSPETYAPLLDAILAYTSCSSIDVSIQSLEMLYLLSQRLVMFSQNGGGVAGVEPGEEEMWSEYWAPLFLGFASSVRDARGKVRNCALGVMERVIASGGSTELLTAGQWQQVLSTVILPLMTQLFSSQGYLSATLDAENEAQRKIFEERNAAIEAGGRGGRARGRSFSVSAEHDEQLVRSVTAACSKTRMRAVTLTSKTILQHHMVIADGLTEDSFTELWMGVLEVFRAAVESGMNIGSDDMENRTVEVDDVSEHVPESVKNLLLVMCDCGLLKKEQHVRWNATFALVRQFVPDIEDVISAATQGGAKGKEHKIIMGDEEELGGEGNITEVEVREDEGAVDETGDVDHNKAVSSVEVSS